MKRKKFKDIKTKEDRNGLLNYLLDKEIELLRKKLYKYQRCSVFNYPVTIQEKDFNDWTTAGCYVWNEKTGTHEIYISTRRIDNYIRTDYDPYSAKIFDKMDMQSTLLHELVHALVREKFEILYSKIKNKNADGSPIFLSCLQYLNGNSSHDCATNYLGTEMWKEVCKMKEEKATWNDFINYIYSYVYSIYDYQEIFNKENILNGINIAFNFGYYESGLRKDIETITKVSVWDRYKKEFKSITAKNITFDIGSTMNLDRIKQFVTKKLNNDVRANISCISNNKMVCDSNTKYTNWVYKKEDKYSSYLEAQKVADLKK
ncbi:hypothetical protein [Clostridium beijerinckii]|uniref:hypothetical protein n=1 Tax=Clostridium beijerinckii TaxID=1520 RepID=UPI00098C3B47|nr:hypothetical protein [Clostridium beijerinckii]MBA8935922.1 hypothetical protein [Clostridium beijerinckii]NRU35994.1 hypothetical protein [Clostridium beijerinckii]NSB00725.1 hypothetical protein [Clostridium beijerinckii]OOM53883.1 hypothetical protein CLOBI_49390 [Clostridium beijerinckii]OOM66964.1 hypothetical protein CLBEIC_45010 [Clostridium beijerinckii]